jgi:hypothetical protein
VRQHGALGRPTAPVRDRRAQRATDQRAAQRPAAGTVTRPATERCRPPPGAAGRLGSCRTQPPWRRGERSGRRAVATRALFAAAAAARLPRPVTAAESVGRAALLQGADRTIRTFKPAVYVRAQYNAGDNTLGALSPRSRVIGCSAGPQQPASRAQIQSTRARRWPGTHRSGTESWHASDGHATRPPAQPSPHTRGSHCAALVPPASMSHRPCTPSDAPRHLCMRSVEVRNATCHDVTRVVMHQTRLNPSLLREPLTHVRLRFRGWWASPGRVGRSFWTGRGAALLCRA